MLLGTRTWMKWVLLSAVIVACCGCRQVKADLLPAEAELVKKIGFDRQVMMRLKGMAETKLRPLMQYNAEGEEEELAACCLTLSSEQADRLLDRARRDLISRGYQLMLIEHNFGYSPDVVGVFKGTNPYDVLRLRGVSAPACDLTNELIVARLKEWARLYDFYIRGVDRDWVELEFNRLPADLEGLAADAYQFCPDAVDQGAGSVIELAKEIKRTRRLLLWWD